MPEYKTPLHYRFHEEDFDTAYLPNQSNAAGTIFQGEWSSAWDYYGMNHETLGSWATEHIYEVSAYGYAPAFRVYASSAYDGDYRASFAFINQYRGTNNCAVSKNAYPSTTDPYVIGLELCHTTAKFTAFQFTIRPSDPTRMAKDIEILGSKDGVNFVSLIKYTNTVFTSNGTFTVNIPTDKQDWYKAYRFKTTSSKAGSGWVMFGFITPIGKWKSYRVQQIPLYTRDDDIEMVLGSGDVDQSYTTAGTYSITLASDSIVEVEVAGAGGGGSGAAQRAGDKSVSGGAGGRGGKSTHIVSVPAGTYEIIVGAGGKGTPKVDGGGSDCKSLDAPAGGDSSVFGIVEKGGGGGTHAFSRGTNTYNGSDGASYGEGGLGGAKGLAYQPSPDGDGKDGEDGWVIIKSQTNKAAPIKMDGNTVFAAYDLQTNQFASALNCKLDGDTTGQTNKLLLRQISDGSYACNTAGTITFTVPRGVKNVQCKAGSVSSWDGYTNYIKDEKGQYWAYVCDYRVSSGESYDNVSDRREYVVAVSSGKTYSLEVRLDHNTLYPTINWGAAINEMTPTVFAD